MFIWPIQFTKIFFWWLTSLPLIFVPILVAQVRACMDYLLLCTVLIYLLPFFQNTKKKKIETGKVEGTSTLKDPNWLWSAIQKRYNGLGCSRQSWAKTTEEGLVEDVAESDLMLWCPLASDMGLPEVQSLHCNWSSPSGHRFFLCRSQTLGSPHQGWGWNWKTMVWRQFTRLQTREWSGQAAVLVGKGVVGSRQIAGRRAIWSRQVAGRKVVRSIRVSNRQTSIIAL